MPDNTAEQLLGLLTSEKTTSQRAVKDVVNEPVNSATNEPTSLLSSLDKSPPSVDYSNNSKGEMLVQDDLFSMSDVEPEKVITPNNELKIENLEIDDDKFKSSQITISEIKESKTTELLEISEQPQNNQDILSNEIQSDEFDKIELQNQEPVESLQDEQATKQALKHVSEQLEEQSCEQSTTPLLDNFYLQLCELISQQPQQLIDKTTLDSHFPEFEIMGKQALEKWLKHLVEQGKLLRPSAKKKQFILPVKLCS